MPKVSTNTGSPLRTSVLATMPYSPAKSITASPDGWRCIADHPFGMAAYDADDAENRESTSTSSDKDARIPRPLNKFMLFRKEMCNRDLPPLADVVTAAEKSKVIGQLWKALSEEEKRIWGERAEVAKQEHERQYPGYKYQPQPRHPKKRKIRFVGSDSGCDPEPTKDQSYDGPASFRSRAFAQLSRYMPITQTASEPPRITKILQPSSIAYEADWFDFAGFENQYEQQRHSGRTSASDNGLQQFPHRTSQSDAFMPATTVEQPSLFPSMALHARTDNFGSFNEAILTSNKTGYEPSASLAGDVNFDSLTVRLPTAETDLGGNVARSFESPENGPNCFSSFPSGSRDERLAMSPRSCWDFVTPDQPKDEQFMTSWPHGPQSY